MADENKPTIKVAVVGAGELSTSFLNNDVPNV
jgi:hypothetical protein